MHGLRECGGLLTDGKAACLHVPVYMHRPRRRCLRCCCCCCWLLAAVPVELQRASLLPADPGCVLLPHTRSSSNCQLLSFGERPTMRLQ